MKDWQILNKSKLTKSNFKTQNLINILLENRGLHTKKETEDFLNPTLNDFSAKKLNIDKKSLDKSLYRIKKAIKNKEKIIIFGDYDVDGITGTAILWETLTSLGADVMPYIPHRTEEGYGLSIKGIENLKEKYPDTGLIITVDNGIVANTAVDFASKQGIDVIITDHHVPGKKLPNALGLVHSTLICGSAVAWFFSTQITGKKRGIDDHLALVALATVADLMKLTGFNRALVVEGLKVMHGTKRVGLMALIRTAVIKQEDIDVYQIGHVIAPRINAMGRLNSAMDSLRLLCTKSPVRARDLATLINNTNLERQKVTIDSTQHARGLVGKSDKRLLFISHETYEPGVVGLIAGRISEEFYRPTIVASVGKEYTKASARSVAGFNIIEFLRLSSDFLVDAGGHPGAAGFTIETNKLAELQKFLEELGEKEIHKELLIRRLRIDCELDLRLISLSLLTSINKLAPFGYGNPEPTFFSKGVKIEAMRLVGADQKHLKLSVSDEESKFDAILFNYDQDTKLKAGDSVDIAYSLSENEWNGNKKLELRVRDLKN